MTITSSLSFFTFWADLAYCGPSDFGMNVKERSQPTITFVLFNLILVFRSVNPISTRRKADYAHQITTCFPPDFQTFLWPCSTTNPLQLGCRKMTGARAAQGGARLNFAVLFTWQLPGTPGFQFELLQNCFKWPRNKQQQSKIAHDSIKMIG